MKKYGSILHEKWVAASNSTIEGTWAEDGSKYYIRVPYQLLDTILLLQKELHLKYRELEQAEANLASIKSDINRVFN